MIFYKTVVVPTEASKEITKPGLTSTEAEKYRVLACYPDDSLTTSYFVGYHQQSKDVEFYIDNLVGEASKRIRIERDLDLGRTFHVGYINPAAVSGDKMVVIEYEIIG